MAGTQATKPSGSAFGVTIEFDVNGHTLKVGDVSKSLTHVAFQLLRYLVEREAAWVSSRELHGAVFRASHPPYGSGHRWHVHQLRQKLGDFSGWVHNDSRLGYMFQRVPCARKSCWACSRSLGQVPSTED